MAILVLSAALCLLLVFLVYLASKDRQKLAFPGPKGLPLFGCFFEMKQKPPHELFLDWSTKYGGVFTFSIFGKNYLVVSSPQALQEVLVTRGKDFGGRPKSYRHTVRTDGLQDILVQSNFALLKELRQIAQPVLNTYGRGRGRLEVILDATVDNLVENFCKKDGTPFDAFDHLYEATSLAVIMILSGQCPEDQAGMFRDVKEMNTRINASAGTNLAGLLLDIIPALRFLPWYPAYTALMKCVKAQDALCEKYVWPLLDKSKDSEHQSLGRALLDSIGQPYGDTEHLDARDEPGHITMTNVKQVCIDIVLAGTITTSHSFYALLAILVCHPDIQERMAEEIATVVDIESRVTLDHKDNLHYIRAVILELLRYSSVGALTIPHVTRKDTELCGSPVPSGTEMIGNLWGCHHDSQLWDDPWAFKPERFLTEEGYLVAADHPNRKRLFPFGAGTRVCLGELLATNRLILFTVNIVKQFKLLPGEDGISCDARLYTYDGVTKQDSFQIRAVPRMET